jgi:hypothetical protein
MSLSLKTSQGILGNEFSTWYSRDIAFRKRRGEGLWDLNPKPLPLSMARGNACQVTV